MERYLIEKKPAWWLLYVDGAAFVGVVGLLEVSVANDAARLVLELGAVVAMFVLMLVWLRVNRGRIELAETRVARPDTREPIAQNGSQPVPFGVWLERRPRGVRRVS